MPLSMSVGFWDGLYASQLPYVWYDVIVKSNFKPCIFCVALLINGYVSLVCCVTNSVCELFSEHFAIYLGVVVNLLLNVMEVLSVGGGALLDRPCMVFQRMCVLCL